MAKEAGQRAFHNARLRKQQRAEANELFSRAIALHQAGDIAQAQALYVQILRTIPDHFDALHFLGVAESQCGHYEVAERLLQHALVVDPRSAMAHANRGIVLHDLGRLEDALASFDQALAIERNSAEALCNRGNVLHDLGRFEDALASYDRALVINPGSADAYSNRTNPLRALKRFDEALASADKAIALNPKFSDAHLSRGNALHDLERFEEAVESYDKTIALNPRSFLPHVNRGNALRDLRRFDEALASLDTAIALNPNSAEAFNNRGSVLKDLRRLDDALASYESALAINPGFAEAISNQGDVLLVLMRYEDAFACYDRALAINPDLAEAWLGRADVLLHANRLTEALAACGRVLDVKPKSVRALTLLGQIHEKQSNAAEAVAFYDKALVIRPDHASTISNRIFAFDFIGDCGFEEHQAARKLWWDRIGAPTAAKFKIRHANSRDPAPRIVLGYVSSDFRHHSAAFSFRPILQHHDRTRFEVVCYSSSPKQDDLTVEFQRMADRWVDASQMSNDRLAEQIQADQIDILVDLSGHSAGHRLGVFARKPAPVQVTAWGHATGTGLPTIDYLFSDPVAIPQSARHLFAEKIYDLPCLITTEQPPFPFQSTDPPISANGYVTFGVFNRISKISDEAVDVWSRILHAEPGSRLVIKHGSLDDAAVKELLGTRFTARGITADHIDLLGGSSREDHLNAYRRVDICLDPFPQNGGVSTWEALHRGVPVLAKLGNSLPSRISGAILAAVGLKEWITDSIDEYVAIAAKFAAMPDELRRLRYELPEITARCDAGDSIAYTKAVERAYVAMWNEYCGKQA